MDPILVFASIEPSKYVYRYVYIYTHIYIYYYIIAGSLEVKLPTIWTDEKQRWEESEKRREEKKKEDQSRERIRGKKMQVREKAEKSRITVFFPTICVFGESKK